MDEVLAVGAGAAVVVAGAAAWALARRRRRRRHVALERALPSYVNREGWRRYYLATYPRSGNHWVRHLIEEASGRVTGSVARDDAPKHVAHIHSSEGAGRPTPHEHEPYPWGGYAPPGGYTGERGYPGTSEPVVIKTHYPAQSATPFDTDEWVKSVCIVRHPADSLWSYYAYQSPRKRGDWKAFLAMELVAWRRFHEHWHGRERVATFRFEDLLEKPSTTLTALLRHLDLPASPAAIARALERYPPRGRLGQHLDHYDEGDRRVLREGLDDLLETFSYEVP